MKIAQDFLWSFNRKEPQGSTVAATSVHVPLKDTRENVSVLFLNDSAG